MVKFEALFQDSGNDDAFKADRKKRVGGYILGRTLGEGSFAKVRIATHIATDEKVAIKVINKRLIVKRDYVRKNMRREAVMLQRLDHPNIVGLIEVMETENSFYIVNELAEGGDFMKYLTDRNCLDEAETRKFMREIVSSVDHMHRSGVIHRDLKIENLLLDTNNDMQIIDFGLSNYYDGKNLLHTQCGSPAYAAPEIFSKQAYGPAVDVWSIGINMFAMLTGRLPFLVDPPNNLSKLHALIMQGCKIPEYFSRTCQDLLSRLLEPSEKDRISIEEIMTHPWINLGNMPLHPRGLKMKLTNADLSRPAIFYMTTCLKIPESQVRESVINYKPNSTTGTYLLLCQRLNKGLGLPDSVQYIIEEIDTSPQKTHRTRPSSSGRRSGDHKSGDSASQHSSTNNNGGGKTEVTQNRRNPPETEFAKLKSNISISKHQDHANNKLHIHRPHGEPVNTNANGFHSDQLKYTAPESHYESHEHVNHYNSKHMNGHIANGYIQREKATYTIGSATSNRDLDVHHQQVFELKENVPENKRTSLPDIPKEIGTTPRNRLKDIFKLSAKLRKPKTKKNVLKGQDKSQSMPEQLNHIKPPSQLQDSLAIKNLRLFKIKKDVQEDLSYKKPQENFITHPVNLDNDFHYVNDVPATARVAEDRHRPISRDNTSIYGSGEYNNIAQQYQTPPSTGGRKYGYIKPNDRPQSKYNAQRERSQVPGSFKIAMEELTQRPTSAYDLHKSHKVGSVKDLVNISNVGYYTIPDQTANANGMNFPRNRTQYRSDNSLTTLRHNHASQFLRKDAKRITMNTELYRGYRRHDTGEGISGVGIAATPR